MSEQTAYQFRRGMIISNIAENQRELQVCDALGEIEGAGRIYISIWGQRIDIDPKPNVTARQLALNVLSALKAKGAAPSKAEKTFDASTGKVTFKIPMSIGGVAFSIDVCGGEPRCKVKEVIEEYMVEGKPAVEAHLAKRKRYVIENPEECGAEVKE
jgi:hypothetical protein